MQNKIQGDYKLEVKFVDETRVYLNFWDVINGNDVCCQIKDGKLHKFVHSPMEVEADEVKDKSEIKDVFEQTEISLTEFLELVQCSILKQSLPCTHTFKTTYIGVGYVAQCTKCGFVRQ